MRIIIHIDMDAFFAAVEERYNPQFRGKPLVVGADPDGGKGRGVVATANYAARRFGIRSAMPITRAWRLAEEARQRGELETVFLTGNHELYGEVSDRIMEILSSGTDAFEPASIDEAYLDVSSCGSFAAAEAYALRLKREILMREGLTCSAGIGPNKLMAKMASEFRKPDGLTVVLPDDAERFLTRLPIRALPGIGPKAETVLHARGVITLGDLQRIPRQELTRMFGAWGEALALHSHGISDDPVSDDGEAKSIGEQETFATDTLEAGFILERARALSEYVFARFSRSGFRMFRTVVITVRFADFRTKTRSHTSRSALGTFTALDGEVMRLLLPFLDARENPERKKIRLIGVRVEKLS